MPIDPAASRRRATPILAVLVVASFGLAGCAARAPAPLDTAASVPAADDFPRSRQVALDFVDAMVRLPELKPSRTTLYTTRPRSRFGGILVVSLQNAGYDLRLGADGDPETLGYEVYADHAPGDDAAGERYTFLVTAGGVRLKRTYGVDESGIRPLTAMRLHGTTAIALDDAPSRFDAVPPPLASRAVPSDGSRGAPRAVSAVPPLPEAEVRPSAGRRIVSPTVPIAASPGATRPAPPLPPRVVDVPGGLGAGGVRPAVAATATATTSVGLIKRAPADPVSAGADLRRKSNMYETRRSNYADLLSTYDTVRRDVMVFPNDSLHMGRDNKRLARTLADAFDPERDVISVIGCSHGPTALENGNETLANGRSYRVKEALMLAGVDADLVLEEGCWAGEHFDMMPGRGVVVTHKRRAAG